MNKKYILEKMILKLLQNLVDKEIQENHIFKYLLYKNLKPEETMEI